MTPSESLDLRDQTYDNAEIGHNHYGNINIPGSGSTVVGNVYHNYFPSRQRVDPLEAGLGRHGQNVHWTITRAATSHFTGRTEMIDQIACTLQDALLDDAPTYQRRLVITGMGGQGKSEICLQVANRVRSLFLPALPTYFQTYRVRFWGVFWVDVATEASALNGFLTIANRLRTAASTIEDVQHLLASARNQWLLFLDNADDPSVDYQSYFPTGHGGIIMITSRNIESSQHATGRAIALDGLPPDDARSLLLTTARIDLIQHEARKQDADAISAILHGHPLATIQAGAYILRGHCSMSAYPGVFIKQRKRLLSFRPNQAQSRYGDVYTTFEASAEIMQSLDSEQSRDAMILLSMLAMLDPSPFPLSLFAIAWSRAQVIPKVDLNVDGDMGRISQWHMSNLPALMEIGGESWDSFRLIEAVGMLESYSLVTTRPGADDRYISMHPLAHAWARERQSVESQRKSWLAVACITAVTAGSMRYWRQRQLQLRPHLLAVVGAETHFLSSIEPRYMIVRILLACGEILDDMYLRCELDNLTQKLFRWLELDTNIVDAKWLFLYLLSCQTLKRMGQSKEAISLLTQILRIRQQLPETGHPLALWYVQFQLARVHVADGRREEAIALFKDIITLQKRTLHDTHPQILAHKHELAATYLDAGYVHEALVLLEHVVLVRDQTLPVDDISQLASQHQLARAYLLHGQIGKARSMIEKVDKVVTRILPGNHGDLLLVRCLQARVYKASGETDKATATLEEVVKTENHVLVEHHPWRMSSMLQLADAYRECGDTDEELSLLKEVIQIKQKALGKQSATAVNTLCHLARRYLDLQQPKEAISILEPVIEGQQPDVSQSDYVTRNTQYLLGSAYEAAGEVEKAISIMEKLVREERRSLIRNDATRLERLHNLALMYFDNGQPQRAIALLEEVVEIERDTLCRTGQKHFISLNQLSLFYIEEGQYQKACPLLEELVKEQRNVLAGDDENCLHARRNLAVVYWYVGKHNLALETMRMVSKIQEQVLSEDDPLRKESEILLEEWGKEMSRGSELSLPQMRSLTITDARGTHHE